MNPNARIFIAGHRGLVGSAVTRRLEAEGYTSILTATRDQLDLRDQAAVNYWFRANRPEYVFLVAGTVGGILANSTRPAEFIYDNMMIHAIHYHPERRRVVPNQPRPHLFLRVGHRRWSVRLRHRADAVSLRLCGAPAGRQDHLSAPRAHDETLH